MSGTTVTRYFHFTLGPVQGFVAQARRTRDLWAGSYLLSYLAGCAMKALKDKDSRCEIVFPDVKNDRLYQAIADHHSKKPGKDDIAAQVGSLPNRFKAKVPGGVDGSVCTKAILWKWMRIATAVKRQLNQKLGVQINNAIWKRQIADHWDCNWVISDDDSALDIRKNLRTHHPPPEPGEKCTVCGERQELSSFEMGPSKSRKQMTNWWDNLQQLLKDKKRPEKSTLFDLKLGERLCAVCLVKRTFAFPDIAEPMIGWEVPVNYPSTSYMAAVDWIIRVFESCRDDTSGKTKGAVRGYLNAARSADVWPAETATRIQEISTAGATSGLTGVINHRGQKMQWQFFADLDGDAFFKSAIRNPREFEVEGDDPKDIRKSKENTKRTALEDALITLQDVLQPKFGESRKATPFYALLLMDGDNMGKMLRTYKDRQKEISKALAQFTQEVSNDVKKCNGQLIYAGADDVFALLPPNTAIECAKICRDAYRKAFEDRFGADRKAGREDVPKEEETTISAAIEYAHMQTALGVVVKDAHGLLDDVAKDQCGRDGLACRVWKRGGPVLTWAQPWIHTLEVKTTPTSGATLPTLVDEVKYLFQESSPDAGKFSSKFFYKLHDLFELLTAQDGKLTLKEDDARRILVTEYPCESRGQGFLGQAETTGRSGKTCDAVARALPSAQA